MISAVVIEGKAGIFAPRPLASASSTRVAQRTSGFAAVPAAVAPWQLAQLLVKSSAPVTVVAGQKVSVT